MLKDTNVTRNKLDTLLYDLLNEGFKKEFRNLEQKEGPRPAHAGALVPESTICSSRRSPC